MKDKTNHIKNYEILDKTSKIFGNSSIIYFKTDFLKYTRFPNFVPYLFKRKIHIGLPSSPLILVKDYMFMNIEYMTLKPMNLKLVI